MVIGRLVYAVLVASACTPKQQEELYNDLFVDHDAVVEVAPVVAGSPGTGSVHDRCPEGAMPGCTTQTWSVTQIEYDTGSTIFAHLTSAGPSGGNTFSFTAGLVGGNVPIIVHATAACEDDVCDRELSSTVRITPLDPTDPAPDAQNGTPVDTCANAAVGIDGPQTGDTTGFLDDATPNGSCTNGFSAYGPDAFYRFDLTAGQIITATLTPQGWDAMLYVLRACELSSCTAGVDAGGSGVAETTTYAATTNGTYHVVVDSPSLGNKGPYTLTVDVQ